MIVVRQVFQVKWGKAKQAIALAKEAVAIQKRVLTGVDSSTRILTDVTGPFYTLVFEITAPNLATFETHTPRLFADKDMQANMQKMGELVESGSRDVFSIVE
jgi:hypothetical protein